MKKSKQKEENDLIVLERKVKPAKLNIDKIKKKLKKNPKKKKKFKTGTKENKKKNLAKSLSKAVLPKDVQDFHETKLSNMIIYGDNFQELYRFRGVPTNKVLEKISANNPNAKVLINIGTELFKEISLKSYLKLCSIKKIRLSRRVVYINNDENEMLEGDIGPEDCEFEVFNSVENVFSINKLLQVVFTDMVWSDAIIFLTSRDYWYCNFEKDYKILVDTGKDTFDLYDSFDKFKTDYKLR